MGQVNPHRDPLHLLPEPATVLACESCGYGPRDSRLDGKHICSACHWLRSCKRCHQHFATPADEDGYCAQCFSAWLARHPDELADMRAHLESTPEGRAVLRAIGDHMDNNPAQDVLRRLSALGAHVEADAMALYTLGVSEGLRIAHERVVAMEPVKEAV